MRNAQKTNLEIAGLTDLTEEEMLARNAGRGGILSGAYAVYRLLRDRLGIFGFHFD